MKYYCIDCGKKLKGSHAFEHKRCRSCARKYYWKIHPKKRRKKNYCVNCGKEISPNAKRCKSCEAKKRNKNKHHTKETKQKMKKSRRNFLRQNPEILKGEQAPNYIDGRTPLRDIIRHLEKYKNWRFKVFKRDNYTCQECNQYGGNLEAHHKKSFVELLQEFLQEYNQFSPIEDRETLARLAMKWKPFWNINNGKTLCKKCHKLIQKNNRSCIR